MPRFGQSQSAASIRAVGREAGQAAAEPKQSTMWPSARCRRTDSGRCDQLQLLRFSAMHSSVVVRAGSSVPWPADACHSDACAYLENKAKSARCARPRASEGVCTRAVRRRYRNQDGLFPENTTTMFSPFRCSLYATRRFGAEIPR